MGRPFVAGVMQASNTGSTKLDKRYSPCFRDENGRKASLSGKRKRDDVFKCVSDGSRRTLDLAYSSLQLNGLAHRTRDCLTQSDGSSEMNSFFYNVHFTPMSPSFRCLKNKTH